MRAFSLMAVLLSSSASAQVATTNPKELASKLSANVLDGSSFVKLRMEIRQPASGGKTSLNLYLKSRRTQSATDIVYQVIYPKERKGEAVLLQSSSGRTSGTRYAPSVGHVALSAPQMKEGIFGSNVSYEDLLENFFAWENQTIAGTESVGRTACVILESKPGDADKSGHARVMSWIDVKKMVPLRVEKYLVSGQLATRIDTTDVKEDDLKRPVARTLLVQRTGNDSVTEIEGTEIKHNVIFTDSDFTPEGIMKLSPPKSR